jgi:hypothetical protein
MGRPFGVEPRYSTDDVGAEPRKQPPLQLFGELNFFRKVLESFTLTEQR